MKKILNFKLFIFLLGAILVSGITGVVAYNVAANNISYSPSNDSWNVTNVEDALNSLYAKSNGDLNYDIIAQEDIIEYSYTIKSDDTKYKSIMVVVESTNISESYSPSAITIVNNNIVALINPTEYKYQEYGKWVTSDMYVGVINNIVSGDTISINTFYRGRIAILGIK